MDNVGIVVESLDVAISFWKTGQGASLACALDDLCPPARELAHNCDANVRELGHGLARLLPLDAPGCA